MQIQYFMVFSDADSSIVFKEEGEGDGAGFPRWKFWYAIFKMK